MASVIDLPSETHDLHNLMSIETAKRYLTKTLINGLHFIINAVLIYINSSNEFEHASDS